MLQRFFTIPLLALLLSLTPSQLNAQDAIDLFSDVAKTNEDFVRIGAWNLRHIELTSAGTRIC